MFKQSDIEKTGTYRNTIREFVARVWGDIAQMNISKLKRHMMNCIFVLNSSPAQVIIF